ncbi:hypothetical protein CDCA_CDCA12G3541 [Cyanidium caldarium]|uniref:Uncharacterized protein n=1 Tax=Cyanidium caldarium TaxID=2771 RepID=A0AAV9IZG2_CYACA|nr:hypothetical protein CDCA_CDCA12G3541 [Cyanidium caldarium]
MPGALPSIPWSGQPMRTRVPWHDEAEWEWVCACLLDPPPASDDAQIAAALRTVASWRVRAPVPFAVDAAADLAAAQRSLRRHRCDDPSFDICHERALRLQLSLIITRLVSAFTDMLQRRARFAQSVGALAGSVHMPPLPVDLRHAAVHNELPSLPALQLAAQQLQAFLRERYVQQRRRSMQRRFRRVHHTVGKTPSMITMTDDDDDDDEVVVVATAAESPSTPLDYVEARWMARELALAMAARLSCRDTTAVSASPEDIPWSETPWREWQALAADGYRHWPHFLPTMVLTWVQQSLTTTDAEMSLGACSVAARRTRLAQLVLAVCRCCVSGDDDDDDDHGDDVDRDDLPWIAWLQHTALAADHDDLAQWCRQQSSAASATVHWQTGEWPSWQVPLVPTGGGWRRCLEWPACPIGTLPLGYRPPSLAPPITASPVPESAERVDRIVRHVRAILSDGSH